MTRAHAQTLIVAISTIGVLLLLTEQAWKPALVHWLLEHPVIAINCGDGR